jgi:hypothetical protein
VVFFFFIFFWLYNGIFNFFFIDHLQYIIFYIFSIKYKLGNELVTVIAELWSGWCQIYDQIVAVCSFDLPHNSPIIKETCIFPIKHTVCMLSSIIMHTFKAHLV